MKKIKKNLLMFKVLLAVVTALVFCACSDDSGIGSENGDRSLYPDNRLYFGLVPNDMANNDSSSSNLAHGITLQVHPHGSYELSFDADENGEAPNMQVFRLYLNRDSTAYNANKIRNLTAEKVDGRYVYSFTCEENAPAYWAVTLEQNGTYYRGSTNKVRFVGSGEYSDHMSLNLVVVGNIASKLNGFTVEELAHDMLDSYRKYYTSVFIDTLYVSYAHEHPKVGKQYPADEPWIAGRSSDDVMLSNLGGWPGIQNALDIVLAHYIDQVGTLGYSALFSGNMGSGDGSTVILGGFVKGYQGQIPLTKDEIIVTALHETGHFFGLRHSTSSNADMQSDGDYSNYEDGLEDTPYCSQLLKSGLLKKAPQVMDYKFNRPVFKRIQLAAAGIATFDPEECPDVTNYMFPLTTEKTFEGFSEQQLEILRTNLKIFPH